jgi:hypothetical protein
MGRTRSGRGAHGIAGSDLTFDDVSDGFAAAGEVGCLELADHDPVADDDQGCAAFGDRAALVFDHHAVVLAVEVSDFALQQDRLVFGLILDRGRFLAVASRLVTTFSQQFAAG